MVNYKIQNVISDFDCQVKHCRPNRDCMYFAYIKNAKTCYLKTKKALENLYHEDGVIFGPRRCKGKSSD